MTNVVFRKRKSERSNAHDMVVQTMTTLSRQPITYFCRQDWGYAVAEKLNKSNSTTAVGNAWELKSITRQKHFCESLIRASFCHAACAMDCRDSHPAYHH